MLKTTETTCSKRRELSTRLLLAPCLLNMGDDPYNFEIALPASSISATRSNRKNSSNYSSDEEPSDASDSMSGISSESERDNDKRHSMEPKFKTPTKAVNERRAGATTTPSSGSALDKAKSFLSRYSSVTTSSSRDSKTAVGSRSQRINLDSDDEDFSLESSLIDENEGTSNEQTTRETLGETNTRTEHNHPTQTSGQHDAIKQVTDSRTSGVNDLHSDDDVSQNSDHAIPYNASRDGATLFRPATTIRPEERSSGGSQAEDSVESFHSQSGEEEFINSPPVQPLTTLPKAVHHNRHEGNDDEYNESFHEESMASHSNMMASQDITQNDTKSSIAKLQQSIASESGVYDEDAFEEEESTLAVQQPATKAEPAITLSPMTHQALQKTAGTFDYSMDFSEDESTGQIRAPTYLKNNVDQPNLALQSPNSRSASVQSDDDRDREEQSALLEFESTHEDNRDTSAIESIATILKKVEVLSVSNNESFDSSSASMGGLSIPNLVSATNTPHEKAQSASTVANTSTIDKKKGYDTSMSLAPQAGAETPFTTATVTTKQAPAREVESSSNTEHVVKNRPRVAIIRACSPDENRSVEMKDASTQFTGNHAAIQTDLVPDGMHSLCVNSSSMSTPLGSHREDNSGRGDNTPPIEVQSVHQRSEQPPPPPVSPLLGSPMHSMDVLRLPMTASSSIYKQQLLALQDQILQKKRETERIVHDRMTFQYSSLRGTERFIAARRTQKLELWEALMRVDPMLSERKAREVARLAQATST